MRKLRTLSWTFLLKKPAILLKIVTVRVMTKN